MKRRTYQRRPPWLTVDALNAPNMVDVFVCDVNEEDVRVVEAQVRGRGQVEGFPRVFTFGARSQSRSFFACCFYNECVEASCLFFSLPD